jgi:hypothetical protein
VIQDQETQQEETEVERTAEVVREEHVPPPTQEVLGEGRKIYVTKSGEKYHLSQGCETLRGYRSYERKACEVCRQRTEQIRTISIYGSPNQRETELMFVQDNELYHDKDKMLGVINEPLFTRDIDYNAIVKHFANQLNLSSRK